MKLDRDTLRLLPFEMQVEISENLYRKDLTQEEIAIEQEEIAKILVTHQQRGRPRTSKDSGKGPTSGTLSDIPEGPKEVHKTKTDAIIGNLYGEGHETVRKRREVVTAAKVAPKKFGPLLEEMNRTNKVGGAHKKLKREKAIEEIAKEPPPLPKGPFRVIVADPPWTYYKRAEDITHRGSCPYPSMSIDEIAAMDVAGLAHKNSVLWLWVTNAHLPEVWSIVEAWGFIYKTMLTWAKDRMGTGDWLRGKTEHCLLCVRGKSIINLTNQTTLLNGKMRKHSQKPEEFYRLVEALCPGSKVELFSREKRKGWMSHGNEI